MAEQMIAHATDDNMTQPATPSESPPLSPHKSTLLTFDLQSARVSSKFYEFYQSGELCDVELTAVLDNHRIAAHRTFLCAASPYFKSLLAGPLSDTTKDVVEINGITGKLLEAFIVFSYTGEIDINDNNVDDVVAAATMLQFDDVEDMCEDFLLDQLAETNCLGLWQLGAQYELQSLKKIALEMVLHNFDVIVKIEEFYNLKLMGLQMLLANDDVFVFSEEDIFNAVVQWVQYDEEERAGAFGKLMPYVRVAEIKMKFLMERVRPCCLKWNYSFDKVLEILNTVDTPPKPRTSASRPIPLSLGGQGWPDDTDRTLDEFVIRRYNDYTEGWQLVARYPGYRFCHVTLQVDNYLYVIGGCGGTYTAPSLDFNRTFQRINLSTWHSEDLPPMLNQRYQFQSAVYYDGFIFVIGGDQETGIQFEKFNLKSRQWDEIDSFKFDRKEYDLFHCNQSLMNDECLFMTGGSYFAHAHPIPRFWSRRVTCYSPSLDTWIGLRSMINSRVHHYPFVYDGFVYVAGGDAPASLSGILGDEQNTDKDTIERFDHIFGEWSMIEIADPNVPKRFHKCFYHDGSLFIYGRKSAAKRKFGRIDMKTLAWFEISSDVSPNFRLYGELLHLKPYDPST